MKIREYLIESEQEFWNDIYKNNKTHWTDKSVSNLTKACVRKYKKFNSILEIGCAAGIDTFYLAEYTNKIIGIDIVKDAIELSKKNLKNQPKKIQDKITFEVGDAERLKYKDSQFDFVYSLSVLHSTDVTKSLKEVRRVLTDNGKSVIYVYIGKGKEEVDKDLFIKTCEEYFVIIDQKVIKIDSDRGNDQHTALIVYLEVK